MKYKLLLQIECGREKKMNVELNFTHFLLKKCDWKNLVVFPFIVFYWGVQSPPSQNKFEREKIIEWVENVYMDGMEQAIYQSIETI